MTLFTFNNSFIPEDSDIAKVPLKIVKNSKTYDTSFVNLISKEGADKLHINLTQSEYNNLNSPKDNKIYFITDSKPDTIEETWSPYNVKTTSERLDALIEDYDITYDKLENIIGSSLETKMDELIEDEN